MTSSPNPRPTVVSVCLAAHNGAAFLREQVLSVLPQLGPAGELIAVDDASSDNTVAILESFGDPRIRILRHRVNQGVVAAFEHALLEARGEFLFLCDQDDVWREDKVKRILEVFEQVPTATLIHSGQELIDSQGKRLGAIGIEKDAAPPARLANLLRNHYQGSAMAFRRASLVAVLPFPRKIPMHDSWIGLVNAIVGHVVYISEPLIRYRRHNANVTTGRHASAARILTDRWHLMSALACRCFTLARVRKTLRIQTAWTHAEAAGQ